MSVRSSQDALPGLSQEYKPTAGDVCAVQLVDGAQANDSRAGGMSAPNPWPSAPKQALMGQKTGKLARNSLCYQVSIHTSTRGLAGVVQTMLRQKTKSILEFIQYLICSYPSRY